MSNNNEHLAQMLKQIEGILDRGASSDWTTYDFEKLSDAIYDRTQVRLSVTTLKRIFGRLKYDSAPTLATLNTLAQFAGFNDWQHFKQNATRPVEQEKMVAEAMQAPQQKMVVEAPPLPQRKWKRFMLGLAGILVLVVVVFVVFLSAGRRTKVYDPAQFDFSANKVMTEGVPNSVIFHYTARQKPDSLFIVQTWDLSRKTLVPADKHEHSAIYYYPGYFKAKLIADGQIVKTHDLWITTGGWLCLLEAEPVPVYFKKQQCLQNGIVEVTDSMLSAHRQASAAQKLRFFNQQDLGELMNDNFTFETMVKNNFDDGSNACHKTQVLIQCKDDIIIIPLAAQSCVGDLSLYFCGWHAESKSADLSAFGCDLTQWTSLRIETVNKAATIYVNNKKASTFTFPNKPTGIVGVQYRFNGAAAVKGTRFTAGGKVYELK